MTLEIGADNVNIATDKIISVDFPVVAVTGAMIPGVHRRVGLNPSLNDVTALLPAAATVEDVVFLIMRVVSEANTVTIEPDGAEEINGRTSIDLLLVGDFIEIVSDGVGWKIINFGDQSIINPFIKPNNVLIADGELQIGEYNVIVGGTTFTFEELSPVYDADLDLQILVCNLSGSTITIQTPAGEDIYLDNGLDDTHDLLDSESMVLFPTSSTTWAIRSQRNRLADINTDTLKVDTLKVGDGATTPATDTIADFESTTGAILLPRMTTVERDALTPLSGMVLYNITTDRIQGFFNGTWSNL